MRIKSILAALLAVVISAGAFCVPAFAFSPFSAPDNALSLHLIFSTTVLHLV